MSKFNIILEILAERERQDSKFGGPQHDDSHKKTDWLQFIREYVNKAENELSADSDCHRTRLIQVAALALAAIECIDRAKPSHTVTEHETNPLKGLIEIASQENELMFSALTKIISHEAPDIFELASAMRSDAEVAVNAIKLSRILRDPNALKEEE